MKPEETSEFVDTASTDFYKSQPFVTRKNKPLNDSSTLEGLEEQIAKIKETILSGQQLIKRLQSNEQLQACVQETQQELKVVRNRNINEQNNIKSSFQQNFASLQRQLNSLKSNWSSLKKRTQAQIQEEIDSFKQKVKADQTRLSKTFKTTSTNIRDKANLVILEMKQTKKLRTDSSTFLMHTIQQARAKFETLTDSQRKKRNQYQQILLGLLDRTVEQGEKLLRRIC